MIYLPFGSTESKGLIWLIINESQDKIKSPLHIFSSFLLYLVSSGTHMYKFCESQRQSCEYMKQDSQVKKITGHNNSNWHSETFRPVDLAGYLHEMLWFIFLWR